MESKKFKIMILLEIVSIPFFAIIGFYSGINVIAFGSTIFCLCCLGYQVYDLIKKKSIEGY